jgi:hypothetical protein
VKRKKPIWVHRMNPQEWELELQGVASRQVRPVAIDAERNGLIVL